MWVTHIWVQCAQYFPFTLPSWWFFPLSLKNRKDYIWQMWNVIPKLQLILIQNTPSSLMEVCRQKIHWNAQREKAELTVMLKSQSGHWGLSWVPWKFRQFLTSLCVCLGCQFENIALCLFLLNYSQWNSSVLCRICVLEQNKWYLKDFFYCHIKMIDMIMYVQQWYLAAQYSDILLIIWF